MSPGTAEARVREVFRGGPRLFDVLHSGALGDLADGLVRGYIENPLPRGFMDGVLLFAVQATKRRYPLYLHGAQLLDGGASDADLDAWLGLDSWDDPGPLVLAWTDRAVPMGMPGTNPREPTTRLLARTVALLAVSPALGGELFKVFSAQVEPPVAFGVLRLLDLWSGLRFRYAAMPRVDLQSDPAIQPYLGRLDLALRNRARVLRPVVIGASAFNDSSEALIVPDDVSATLLETVPVGIIRLDSKGRIGYENPAVRVILGAPADRPTPAHGMRIVDMPNVRYALAELKALVESGTPFELRRAPFTSIFGRKLTVNVVGRPIRSEGGQPRGSMLMIVDASRDEQLEAQVVAIERATVLASLVSRIAHDLNNLLVGVRGHSSILFRALPATDPNHHAAARLDEAAQRISAVVDGLMALAHREDHLSGSPIDVVLVLEDAARSLRDILPKHITLEVVTPVGPLPCCVGPGQLKQVILSLAGTARDSIVAWGDGRAGRIRIRLGQNEATDASGKAPANTLVLTFDDDGVGMNEAQRTHVFDPFALGRTEQVGRGLGMPLSQAIIAAYGGSVDCESQPGAGTRITISMPMYIGGLPLAEPPVEPRTPHASVHVLVVEDNDIVRNLCVDVLESQRYRVTWVESGRAALRLIREGGIDVALIDVGLPDMTGLAVLSAVEQMGSDVRVVLTSGNPPESLRNPAESDRRIRFLRKPFQVTELIQAIDSLVRSPSS